MPSFQDIARHYLTELRSINDNSQKTSELSFRPALDELLKSAAKLSGHQITFISEGKLIKEGRPDFVLTDDNLPIGYIEAELYQLDLDNLKGATKAQNERFSSNLDNFLLTNHLDFRLYNGGKLVMEASLPAPAPKGQPVVPDSKAEKLQLLLETMFGAKPLPIAEPRDLAHHLSRRTRELRDQVRDMFEEGKPSDKLNGAYLAFQKVLLPDLKPFLSDEDRRKPKRPQSFDDLFAQTVAYGLFAARCGHTSGPFTRTSAADYLSSNPFLKEMLAQFITNIDADLRWIVDDMAALLENASIETIQSYFSKRTGREDPMIDFYEPFLQAYDSTLREVRGVYYTPVPVVSYIVRSLHSLLKTRFGKEDGLADKDTLILDPATGTGSFLFAVIDEIEAHVKANDGSGAWPGYVEQHLLDRIFGFELLMAPYAIAHLKLGLQLQGQGASLPDDKRFGVYLTNTLDDAVKQSDVLLGKYISDEANAAVKIKTSEPILVILGNPPYAGHSSNPSRKSKEELQILREERKGAGRKIASAFSKRERELQELTYIGRLIEAYKWVDGEALGEQNSKWLQDDYVKFIAFAQERLRKTGEGVIGYITAHGFLDNATFRGMRQSLMKTFNDIYILDLHGNAKKKEKNPNGEVDQNVFEIQQGVSILFGVKEKGNINPARVHHAELWGTSQEKYETLTTSDISTTKWEMLEPAAPEYFFVRRDANLEPEFNQGWKVTEIFPLNGWGVATRKDYLLVDFSRIDLAKRVNKILSGSLEDAHEAGVRDNPYWTFSKVKNKLGREIGDRIMPYAHRPFDSRSIFYEPLMIERGDHRMKIAQHFLGENTNLSMLVSRTGKASGSNVWDVLFVADTLSDLNLFRRGGAFIHPLYLYPTKASSNTSASIETERRPNFSPLFIKALAEKLTLPQSGEFNLPRGVTPEDIFHYAYAVFHSPSYRELYKEFLKSDFPRLPLTSDRELFFDLAKMGRGLVALHLLNVADAPILEKPGHPFEGTGNTVVERPKVNWSAATQRVSINKTQGFENVSEEVWGFYVGGYQVAEKWLKDRDKRELSFDDLLHYRRVLKSLAETIRLMEEIDERIPSWPIV